METIGEWITRMHRDLFPISPGSRRLLASETDRRERELRRRAEHAERDNDHFRQESERWFAIGTRLSNQCNQARDKQREVHRRAQRAEGELARHDHPSP